MTKYFIVTVEAKEDIRVRAESESEAFRLAEIQSKLWAKTTPGTKLMRIKQD